MELNIPLDLISPNPHQPRQVFDQDELESLAQSLQASTQVLNITVREDPANPGCYFLVDGERRWRAARLAGWQAIRATVLPSPDGRMAYESLVMALVANLQRADLNPIEEAHAYQKLLDLGMSKTDICKSLGLHQNRINSRLVWLDLSPEIQQLVTEGRLPADRRIAEALLNLPESHRHKFAQGLANRPGLTIKAILNAADRLRRRLDDPQPANSKAASPAMRRVADPAPHHYNALAAVGKVPPWETFAQSIVKTCQACALFDVANQDTCQECPLVSHLNQILGE